MAEPILTGIGGMAYGFNAYIGNMREAENTQDLSGAKIQNGTQGAP